MRLAGKVAIVTGATKGIGRVIAATMAAEGAKVVVAGRTAKRGEDVAASIRAAGGEAVFVPADVAEEADVIRLVDTAVETYGSLTTLVNNAASTDLLEKSDDVVTKVTLEAWERVVRVTLTGAWLMSKYAIARMAEGGGGAIVNISSDAAARPMPGLAAYAAAKAGLNSLTRSIAVECAPLGIRANTIQTGLILPPHAVGLFEADPVLGARLRGSHLTRLGRREDIAEGVVYLASDAAAFVTGALLPIDGGTGIMTNLLGKTEIFEGKPEA